MLHKELLEMGRDRQRVDWERLGKAVKYYEGLGYKYVEVPWTVSPYATRVTFTGEVLTSQAGDLLGSAEQAFLDMALRREYIPEKAVTVSPCFRMEPQYDELHHLSFMKVELFSRNTELYLRMLIDARNFFKTCGIRNIKEEYQDLATPVDKIQKDLIADDIELGSYGIRKYGQIEWAYGTGLAEPRTSTVLGKQKPAGY